jgi:cyclophilin family peptidyl-prolyl cis-trans isomerase
LTALLALSCFVIPAAYAQEPEQIVEIPVGITSSNMWQNIVIFGEVINGLKVVDKIQMVATNENDRPLKNIYIKSMTLAKK